jgi:hypothetical protein
MPEDAPVMMAVFIKESSPVIFLQFTIGFTKRKPKFCRNFCEQLFAFIEQVCYSITIKKTNVRLEVMVMKKHGKRMELIGMLALFVLAMASDGGKIGLLPLFLLAGLSIGLILLGDMFTRPRRKYRNVRRQAATPVILRPDFRQAA